MPELDGLTQAAFHARHDVLQAHLYKLEQALVGYGDPQYPDEYYKARKDLLTFFSNINTRLAHAEQKSINRVRAKAEVNKAIALKLANNTRVSDTQT